MSTQRRRRSGPSICPPEALERLSALAGCTTYKMPVGGRGTGAGRTTLDIAASLSVGTARMTAGHAWGNVALLIATSRPITTDTLGDFVDAVMEDVDSCLSPKHSHKLRAGKLRIMLHMLIGNAVGSKATLKRGGVQVKHPDFMRNKHWLPTYGERAQALRMRLTDYARIEREVQAVVESKISEAAASCGAT